MRSSIPYIFRVWCILPKLCHVLLPFFVFATVAYTPHRGIVSRYLCTQAVHRHNAPLRSHRNNPSPMIDRKSTEDLLEYNWKPKAPRTAQFHARTTTVFLPRSQQCCRYGCRGTPRSSRDRCGSCHELHGRPELTQHTSRNPTTQLFVSRTPPRPPAAAAAPLGITCLPASRKKQSLHSRGQERALANAHWHNFRRRSSTRHSRDRSPRFSSWPC
jgi:hypothetical protein